MSEAPDPQDPIALEESNNSTSPGRRPSAVRRLLTKLGIAGAAAGGAVALSSQAGTEAPKTEQPPVAVADPSPGAELHSDPGEPILATTTSTTQETTTTSMGAEGTKDEDPETDTAVVPNFEDEPSPPVSVDLPDGSSGAMTIERPPLDESAIDETHPPAAG